MLVDTVLFFKYYLGLRYDNSTSNVFDLRMNKTITIITITLKLCLCSKFFSGTTVGPMYRQRHTIKRNTNFQT